MTVADINDDTPGARGLRAANLASMALNGHPTRLNPDLPQPPMQGSGQQQEDTVANNNGSDNVSGKKPSLFDPRIGIGNVLTIITMLVGLAGLWNLNEQRMTRQEERQARTDERVAEQKEVIKEVRNDVKDVQRTVNELAARSGVPRRDRN